MKSRIRILPIIIFTATLALTLKVGGIWQGNTVSVSTAIAAEKAKNPGAGEKEAASSDSHSKSGKSGAGKNDHGTKNSSKKKSVGDAFDPTSVTQAEFQVLQRLADRRLELDKLRRDLTLRENLLAATEKKLTAKMTELKGLKSQIEGLLKKHDDEQGAKLKSLVKIYEAMKPKSAARIFEQLEMEILLDVVERMREAKTSLIFAAMDPAKAKAITSRLAERRELPNPSVETDGS